MGASTDASSCRTAGVAVFNTAANCPQTSANGDAFWMLRRNGDLVCQWILPQGRNILANLPVLISLLRGSGERWGVRLPSSPTDD